MTVPPDRYDGPEPGEVYPSPLPPLAEQPGYRQRYVRWLLSQVGVSDPTPYFEIAAPCYPTPKSREGKSWCQIFLLAGLILQGLTKHTWIDGDGFFFRLIPDWLTTEPEPGDAAIFENNKYSDPVWHGCGVLSLDGHRLISVDGNATGGIVRRVVREDIRIYRPRPIFVSIQGLIDAAEALEQADTDPCLAPKSKP